MTSVPSELHARRDSRAVPVRKGHKCPPDVLCVVAVASSVRSSRSIRDLRPGPGGAGTGPVLPRASDRSFPSMIRSCTARGLWRHHREWFCDDSWPQCVQGMLCFAVSRRSRRTFVALTDMRPRLSSSARAMVLMSPCHRYRVMCIAVDCCVGVSAAAMLALAREGNIPFARSRGIVVCLTSGRAMRYARAWLEFISCASAFASPVIRIPWCVKLARGPSPLWSGSPRLSACAP